MGIKEYRPGYYPQKRDLSKLTEEMAKLYCIQVTFFQRDASGSGLNPCIAISRKIGVGAVEIADLVGEALSMKVLDRELMEQVMSLEHNQNHPHLMHERVPSFGEEVLMMLKGNKPFLKGKYAKFLAQIVLTAAHTGPSIFVGRGAHLILPREKVLAVRIIASMEYRVRRVATIMKSGYKETEKKLIEMDKEQRNFFKKFYGKTGSSPYEFDLVINRDFLEDKHLITKIIVEAYRGKFSK